PKDNIERAIKKGTGELAGNDIEKVIYEAYGPGGSALIIESLTDNKNRSLGEIKNILKKHGVNLAGTGSALYLFDRKGAELVAKEKLKLDPEQNEKLKSLLVELNDSPEVNNIYSNAE
ncbi:MAG: YebC/PmpR family DNA-binding transcriptional regulator, partial [bacterium]